MTTTDADVRLLADRYIFKPVFGDSNRTIFVLPRGVDVGSASPIFGDALLFRRSCRLSNLIAAAVGIP